VYVLNLKSRGSAFIKFSTDIEHSHKKLVKLGHIIQYRIYISIWIPYDASNNLAKIWLKIKCLLEELSWEWGRK